MILSSRKAQLVDEGMSRRDSIFLEVVGENFKIKELAATVSPRDQKRFHDRIKAAYRKQISSKPWNCFNWGYRTFNAMKHLLMSAALYVQSKILMDECMDVLLCYGIYYSMFHASFSLLSLHPQIRLDQLKEIKHDFLMNEVNSKFVQTRVLPSSFTEMVEDWRFLRELTSYFAMLGGLEASSYDELKEYMKEVPTGVYENLKLAFQLSGFMGLVLWNVQEECKKVNKKACEKFRSNAEEQEKRYGKLLDKHLESLIEYPTAYAFKYSKFAGERFAFDMQDAWTAINKLGLDKVCPQMLLDYHTKTVSADAFGWIRSDKVHEDFVAFLHDVW
jgi:uncharacterized protein (UPF0332 family)